MTNPNVNWLDGSQIWVGVAGKQVFHEHGSLQVTQAIGQRSKLSVLVDDISLMATPTGTQIQAYRGGGLNILTPNQSNVETDLTGFFQNNSGATLTRDTSQHWQGAASVKCVMDGLTQFQGVNVQFPFANFIAGATYTFSVWILGLTAGPVMGIQAQQAYSPFTGSAIMQFPLTTAWQRVSVTWTMPTPLYGGTFQFAINNPGPVATTFWADGWQIEQDYQTTPWKVGGTTGDVLLTGYVMDAQRSRYGYNSVYPVKLTATDQHYLADKRTAVTTYSYRTCGFMFRDLVNNYLANEGVTYGRGVNLLSAQQSDVETNDMTQFLGGTGVTLTQDTTPANVHHGVGSLKCVTNGASTFQQVEVKVTNNGSNFPYGGSVVASWWMKASAGTPTVRCFVQSSGGTISPVINVTLSTSWQKITVCGEIPFPSSATYYGIRWDTGSGAQALTVWMDQMQVELANATPWVPGQQGVNLLGPEQADVEGSTLGGTITTNGAGSITIAEDTTVPAFHGNGSLKVVVDGSNAFQGVDFSVAGALPANGILTVSFYAMSTTAMQLYIPVVGVGQSNFLPTLTPQWQRFQFTVQLPASPPNPLHFQVLTPAAQAGTWWLDGLQMEVGAAPTAWELGGTPMTIQEGPLVNNYTVPGVPVSKALDDFAQYASYYWYIDPNKVAWFLAPGSQTAPFTFDGSQGEFGSGNVETSSPLYRNAQWLLNIPDVTATQVETRKGDSTTRAFTMSYPLNNVPTITVNGTAKSVGLKGVDDANHSAHFYWSKSDPVIAQEVNDTVLASTDSLVVTYIGQWTSNVYSTNASQIAAQQGIEGGGTSGIVEEAHQDNTITTSAQGFQLASALLTRYGIQGKQFRFSTRWAGLAAGQLLTVNIPSAGWQLQGVTFLIEQVDVTVVGPWLMYTVTAIAGPFNSNWVQFYQWLAVPTQVAGNAAGSNTVGAVAQIFNAIFAWSASFTATVYTCPICAATLHCGPTVKVC